MTEQMEGFLWAIIFLLFVIFCAVLWIALHFPGKKIFHSKGEL